MGRYSGHFPPFGLFFCLQLALLSFPSVAQQQIVVDTVIMKGIKKTHPSVIFREITLAQGDTLSPEILDLKISQSRENLLNLPLFNFVETEVRKKEGSNNNVAVTFTFTERWYIWPYPIVEVADRNFNAWWKTRNLSRINLGGYVLIENFRGRLERLKLLAKSGFDQKFEVEYFKPYINPSKTLGLLFQAGVMGNHEVAAATNDNNQVVFIRDESDYIRTHLNAYAALVYRPGIHNTHEAGIGWSSNHIADTLQKAQPLLWPNNNEQYITLRYQFKHDRRDYKHYPLKGQYFDVALTSQIPLQATHSANAFAESEINLRWYAPLQRRTYWSAGFYGKYSSSMPVSYYLMQGLGSSRYFVRGYEYYLIEGQQTALVRSNLIYNLVKPSEKRVSFIRSEKFGRLHYAVYLRLYADWGITRNQMAGLRGNLSGQWLGGGGAGIDLVTYYDRVLRVEYSINRMGETGLFIHFMASI